MYPVNTISDFEPLRKNVPPRDKNAKDPGETVNTRIEEKLRQWKKNNSHLKVTSSKNFQRRYSPSSFKKFQMADLVTDGGLAEAKLRLTTRGV